MVGGPSGPPTIQALPEAGVEVDPRYARSYTEGLRLQNAAAA